MKNPTRKQRLAAHEAMAEMQALSGPDHIATMRLVDVGSFKLRITRIKRGYSLRVYSGGWGAPFYRTTTVGKTDKQLASACDRCLRFIVSTSWQNHNWRRLRHAVNAAWFCADCREVLADYMLEKWDGVEPRRDDKGTITQLSFPRDRMLSAMDCRQLRALVNSWAPQTAKA